MLSRAKISPQIFAGAVAIWMEIRSRASADARVWLESEPLAAVYEIRIWMKILVVYVPVVEFV